MPLLAQPHRICDQGLLDQSPDAARCLESFSSERFEMIVEPRLRTDDGNVEISGEDLRERTPPVGQGSLFAETYASASVIGF
jgi:hypothetical protein